MLHQFVCFCVLERLDELYIYYLTICEPWACYRARAIAALSKQYRRTGIKALVEFQLRRQDDLRMALRGATGFYASPHSALDAARQARHLQHLYNEGQFIAGLIGLV